MKRTLFLLLLAFTSFTGFAQGKVSFGNNSDRYFVVGMPYYYWDHYYDASLGGGVSSTAGNTVAGCMGAIPVSPLPSGVTLAAALYAGTTANNMTLQKVVVLDSTGWFQAGRMNNYNVILTGVPGGAVADFQIYLYDYGYGTPQAAWAAGSYYGTSGLFTATPGNSITYPNLFAGGPAGSTWGPGNIVLIGVPEPSSLALLTIAAGCVLATRRRRSVPRRR